MSWLYVLGTGLAVALLIYLIAVLLNPEHVS